MWNVEIGCSIVLWNSSVDIYNDQHIENLGLSRCVDTITMAIWYWFTFTESLEIYLTFCFPLHCETQKCLHLKKKFECNRDFKLISFLLIFVYALKESLTVYKINEWAL